jgi:hypothetical protein
MYKGQIGRGLAWLAGTAIGYMVMIVPGIVVHILCIYNAYSGEAARPINTCPQIQSPE